MGGQVPDLDAAGLRELLWFPVDLAARAVLEVAMGGDEDDKDKHGRGSSKGEKGGKEEGREEAVEERDREVAVYHLVSRDTKTDWAQAQDWLRTSENLVPAGGAVSVIDAQTWLDRLDALEIDHPAKSLVPVWRGAWTAKAQAVARAEKKTVAGARQRSGILTVVYDTERARGVSKVMGDGEGMVLGRERFGRMVRWILGEGKRKGKEEEEREVEVEVEEKEEGRKQL